MELVAIHTFTKHHWCCPVLKPWLEQDPSKTWYQVRVEPKKAKRHELSLDRMLLSERSWKHWPSHMILGKQFAHKLLKGFRCSTNPLRCIQNTNTFATCVVSRTLPPKIKWRSHFFNAWDIFGPRGTISFCVVCVGSTCLNSVDHVFISFLSIHAVVVLVKRLWQERVNGWLIYCRGFELLPVLLGFVWQIAFNLSLVSTCQPHFSGNVVWWACRLGLSRGGQTVSAIAVSELIRVDPSTRLEMKRFSSLEICVSIFQLAEMPGLQPALATLRSVKDSGLSELLGSMTAWNHGEWQLQTCQCHWCWGMWMKIFECWQPKLTRQGDDTCLNILAWFAHVLA